MSKNDIIQMFYTTSSSFTAERIFLVMCLALAVAMVIFLTYRFTYRGVSYSSSFNVSNVMILLTAVVIMIMISSNIVISLGMVGAPFHRPVPYCDQRSPGHSFHLLVHHRRAVHRLPKLPAGTGFHCIYRHYRLFVKRPCQPLQTVSDYPAGGGTGAGSCGSRFSGKALSGADHEHHRRLHRNDYPAVRNQNHRPETAGTAESAARHPECQLAAGNWGIAGLIKFSPIHHMMQQLAERQPCCHSGEVQQNICKLP